MTTDKFDDIVYIYIDILYQGKRKTHHIYIYNKQVNKGIIKNT